MPLFRTLAAAVLVVLALGACTKQEPDITLNDQVPAAMRTEEAAPAEEEAAGGTNEGPAATFVAEDIEFTEAPESLPAGPVEIHLDNAGGIIHNVTIEELNDLVVAEAEGGQEDSGTVQLEPGTYTYYCSIPGHRNAMQGTLTVA